MKKFILSAACILGLVFAVSAQQATTNAPQQSEQELSKVSVKANVPTETTQDSTEKTQVKACCKKGAAEGKTCCKKEESAKACSKNEKKSCCSSKAKADKKD